MLGSAAYLLLAAMRRWHVVFAQERNLLRKANRDCEMTTPTRPFSNRESNSVQHSDEEARQRKGNTRSRAECRSPVMMALLPVVMLASACVGILEANAQEHSTAPVEVAEPADYRMNDYRAPVPKSLKGARVVDTEAAAALREKEGAIFIDVYPQAPKPAGLPANAIWRTPKHTSIEGAVWLPNVGYGTLAAAPEAYFKSNLERLTGGDTAKTVIFFCLRDCWMSWNAAKRAMSWGYTSVVWFPDGTDGWQELGMTVADAKPEPGF